MNALSTTRAWRLALSTAALSTLTLALTGASVAMATEGDIPEECALTISSNDQLQFDKSELSVPASCSTVSLTLKHSGSLAKAVMGHNWVLTTTEDFQSVAQAGMQAGPDAGYLPADDDRVLAATDLIGGGESTTTEFSTEGLADKDLTFFCSFPGHYALMKGTFQVTES